VLLKTGFDIHSAVEAGKAPLSVIIPAAPFIIIGYLALHCLGKTFGQISSDNDPDRRPNTGSMAEGVFITAEQHNEHIKTFGPKGPKAPAHKATP